MDSIEVNKPHMCNIRTYLMGTFVFSFMKSFTATLFICDFLPVALKKEVIGGVVCHCNYEFKAGAYNQSHCGRLCCL